jgi:uncharacterized damage-inducible protein DinB
MTNLEFYKISLANELKATYDIIAALPADRMDYKPHHNSRTAYEIAEHIIAHASDFKVALTEPACDELFTHSFDGPEDGANHLKRHWENALDILNDLDENDWNVGRVELLVHGQSFMKMPRANLMWMFLFDIIHHRGQLSTYIRPMGGKNPAVYGFSYDTLNVG